MSLNRTFTYYAGDECNIAQGMRVQVPLGSQNIVGFVDSCEMTAETPVQLSARLGYETKEITAVLDEQPLLNEELYQLGLWMAHETVSPAISCFQAMLPGKIKPRSRRSQVVHEAYVTLKDAALFKTEKQLQALELLRQGDVRRSDFNKAFGGLYNTLLKKGAIGVYEQERSAETAPLDIREAGYPLTDEQTKAIERIRQCDKDVILLHGLTGSGKTEIYMQLAAEICRKGQQVLILVPEISLTPQMVTRMRGRFGNSIAIYHSGLNDQERYEQYRLVQNHEVSIVVGTRSAVFMPFDRLGLIVLDEEHDHSYKQDTTPKYHCRDVAIHRARFHHCKVILGSATPTLESYARAVRNVYELIELKNRIYQNLPVSHLIDMQKQIRMGHTILSQPLHDAIKQRLDENRQCILLLNRRGYTTIMKCRQCGHVMQCPNCDIALSYHKDTNKLMCHTCGYEISADVTCPKCGKSSWNHYGLGTQKLYETIQQAFPEARILRMDADTTRKKGGHQEILDAFGRHEADILLGTQMIAKGLDYPDVTLVGIFNADALLGRMDYRSVEVTFDLIVQASGRSGRGQEAGEVYVQAYDCGHYGIRHAIRQDYISFFNEEMNYRHIGMYPPYCYLAAISFQSRQEQEAVDASWQAAEYFRRQESIKTLGPSQLPRLAGDYRQRIVLKGTDRAHLIDLVWQWHQQLSYNTRLLKVQIDIDPYTLD